MTSHPGNHRLLLAVGHEGQERFVADHQCIALQQRLQRGAAPKLTGGVVGVADPQHRPRTWFRERLRECLTPNAGQPLLDGAGRPTAQCAAVISKTRSRQHTLPLRRGISCRPGEHFGSAVAGQYKGRFNAVQHTDTLTKQRLAAVGVVAPGT